MRLKQNGHFILAKMKGSAFHCGQNEIVISFRPKHFIMNTKGKIEDADLLATVRAKLNVGAVNRSFEASNRR